MIEMNVDEFGKWARAERKSKKMYLKDAERLSGYSLKYISNIESGRYVGSLDLIKNLCNAYGYEVVIGLRRK